MMTAIIIISLIVAAFWLGVGLVIYKISKGTIRLGKKAFGHVKRK